MPDSDDYYGEDSYREQQHELYDIIGFIDTPGDSDVHELFWLLMYDDELSIDDRMAAYDLLTEYLSDEYGLDFADLWDWDDFRAWYEATAG